MNRILFPLFFLLLAACDKQTIDFPMAQRIANERFASYARMPNSQHDLFMAPIVQDRGIDWVFEWKRQNKAGSILVIVHRNGEFSDSDTAFQ